jgi:hypothetical protein
MRLTLSALLLVAPLWLAGFCGVAHAQTGSDAPAADEWRTLAEEGVSLYENGKFAEALEQFEKAYALHPTTQAAVYKARCHVKLGQWLRARDEYARVLADKLAPEASANVKETYAAAQTEYDSLVARIPKIAVVVRGARGGAKIKIDGAVTRAAEQPVDPGRHTVRVASNGNVAEQTVEAIEGRVARVELTLSAGVPVSEPQAAHSPERGSFVPAIAAFGVGAVGLGLGAAMGAVAAGKSSEVEKACPQKTCSTQNAPLLEDARTFAHVSTAGFVVGGAGAAAGVVLLIVRAKSPVQARMLGGRLDVAFGMLRWERAF